MRPKDAVSAKLGCVYVTIEGRRELWANVKNIEANADISSADVPRVGTLVTGSKVTGISYSGKMTVYKVHSAVDDMVQQMADTGIIPYFDVQTVSEDPTANSGRDVKLLFDCHLDGTIKIAGLDSDGEFQEQEVGFRAAGCKPLEKFSNTTSIIAG